MKHGIYLVPAAVLWLVIGVLPSVITCSSETAGQIGDSWGISTSLFSCFGFLLAAYTLLLQRDESHKIAKMQDEQMQLAKTTTEIQKGILRDTQIRTAMECLIKVQKDTTVLKNRAMEWAEALMRRRPAHEPPEDAVEKAAFFNIVAELQADCLMIGLIFDREGDSLGREVEKLYSEVRFEIDKREKLPNRALFEQFINERLIAVRKQMKPVWEKFSSTSI